MWDVIEMIDLFERGLPPVAGGTLDQARWFLDAAAAWRRERAMFEAEALKSAKS